ncbi:MAG: nucleotidyltransferase domain-containing protein [Candidatus Hydrogenedentota bacterium]
MYKTVIQEPFSESLQEIIRVYKSGNPAYMGALVFGSVVEKIPKPTSDLDIIVFMKPPFVESNVVKRVKGVKAEIYIRPFDKIVNAVCATRDFFYTRNIGAGLLVDYINPLVPALKRLAEINWRQGPLRLKTSSHFFIRHKLENMLSELKTRANDEMVKRFLLAWDFDYAISAHYAMMQLYLSKWSYLMGYLKVRDKKLYDMSEEFLLSTDIENKERKLREIFDYIVAPFGGYPPNEWKIVTGEEHIFEKYNDNGRSEWREIHLPPIEEVQPMKDAFGIGINQERVLGQNDLELPPGYEIEPREIFYEEPLQYHDDVVRKVVKEIAKDKKVLGILVFGSHGLNIAKQDSDIDMYIVTENTGRIYERRWIDGVEFSFEWINFTSTYRGIVFRRNTSYWRNFKESKILFCRHPDVNRKIV